MTQTKWPPANPARFSIAAAVAVLFAINDFASNLQNGHQSVVKLFTDLTEGLPLTGKHSLDRITAASAAKTARVTRYLKIANIVILFVATVVWAVGDQAKTLIHSDPQSTQSAVSMDHAQTTKKIVVAPAPNQLRVPVDH